MNIKKIRFPIGIVLSSIHIEQFHKHGFSEQENPFVIICVFINIYIVGAEI
jgi:hypothetical protein